MPLLSGNRRTEKDYQDLEDQLEALNKNLQDKNLLVEQKETFIAQQALLIERLKGQVNAAPTEDQVEELKAKISTLEKTIEKNKKDIKKLKDEKKEIEAQLELAKQFQDENVKLVNKIAELNEIINNMTPTETGISNEEYETLKAQLESAEASLAEQLRLQQQYLWKISNLERTQNETVTERMTALNRASELEKQVRALEKIQQKAKETEAALNATVQEAYDKLDKSSRKLTETEYQLGVAKRKQKGAQDATSRMAKERDEAKAERDVAISERDEARIERDINKMIADELDLEDVIYKLIINEFATSYNNFISPNKSRGDNANGLRKAVNKAKAADKQYQKELEAYNKAISKGKTVTAPVKPDNGYENIMANIMAGYNKALIKSTDVNRNNLQAKYPSIDVKSEGVKVVESLIENNSDFAAIVKGNKKGFALAAGVIGLAALVGLGSMVPGIVSRDSQIEAKDSQIEEGKATINTVQNALSTAEQDKLISDMSAVVEGIKGDYNNVASDYNYATTLNAIYNKEEVSQAVAEETESNYDKVTASKTNADAIVLLDEQGNITSDCALGKAVANYTSAVRGGVQSEIEGYETEISLYQTNMSTYAAESSTAFENMLSETGYTVEQLQVALDMLNAPTVSIADSEIGDVRSEFNVAGRRWNVDKVLSCKYDKASGKVTMLLQNSKNGESAYSALSFTMDRELMIVSVDALKEAFKAAKNSNTLNFVNYANLDTTIDNTLVTLDGATGNVQVGYILNESNTAGKYKVGGDAIIILTDANGELVASKVVSVDAKVSNDLASEREVVVNSLLEKINSTLGTSATLSNDADENEAE